MKLNKPIRHIAHLQELHNDLDKQIHDAIKNYKDDSLVTGLKKKKLALKDEIERFRNENCTNN
jgi:hypothetical protein